MLQGRKHARLAKSSASRNASRPTPAQSRSALDLRTPGGVAEYLRRHHLHHVCIGHTHNPQSQPHFTLKNLGALVPLLGPVLGALSTVLPDFLEPQLKTMYFNSGTAGWMEGLVWAIEVDETGQARLVYWTDNSKRPEKMDRELSTLPASVKDHLLDGLRNALQAPATEVSDDDYFTIRAPISAPARAGLERLNRILIGMGVVADAALHVAGLALAAFDQFPRNVPCSPA